MSKSGSITRRGSSWQVDMSYVDVHGVTRRLRYQFPSEEEASRAHLRMQLAVSERRDPRREAKGRVPKKGLMPESLKDLRDYCLQYVWAGTRGEDTAISTSGRVVDIIGGHLPIRGISTGTARQAIKALESEQLAPATINRITGCLSKMLSVALEEGWIDSKPRVPRVEVPSKEARFLYEDELDKIFAGYLSLGDQAGHDLSVFLLWTGCRVGEALQLTWGDIDLSNARVTFTKTKTNRNRAVPIAARALKVLERLKDQGSEQPFVINQDTFGKKWNKLKEGIGIDDASVTPHTLRHTCAARLVMSGVSLYEVAKWLGHTTIATTQIYAHLAPDHLRGAAEVLEMRYDNGESDDSE